MGRLIMCVGNCAEIPYCVESGGVRLYSIEELCYFICDNAEFLEGDFVNGELVRWIEAECGLGELAGKLWGCLKGGRDLFSLLEIVLRETYYCTEEELRDIGDRIAEQKNLNVWEKRKRKIDYLFKKEKYSMALGEYEILRRELGRNDPILTSRVSHNIGAVYAQLFLFEQAAANFKIAFEESGSMESYRMFLGAKRMLLKDEEYLDFLSHEDGSYEVSLELERSLEALHQQWEESGSKRKLEELQEFRSGQEPARYYREADKLVEQWKNEYRRYVCV